MWDEKKLLEICEKYRDQAPKDVIVPEPYIPYVRDPENWNRILVLAESQNFGTGSKYYKWLNEHKTEPEKLMTRLKQNPYGDNRIGVGPWDGRLGELVKSVLRAIFKEANLDLEVENVAVSNAVPWTKKRSGSRNESSNKEMRCKARSFWKEIFEVWKPDIRMLIVLGKKAEEVMKDEEIQKNYKGKWFRVRHPSRAKKISYVHQAVEEFKNSGICLISD